MRQQHTAVDSEEITTVANCPELKMPVGDFRLFILIMTLHVCGGDDPLWPTHHSILGHAQLALVQRFHPVDPVAAGTFLKAEVIHRVPIWERVALQIHTHMSVGDFKETC